MVAMGAFSPLRFGRPMSDLADDRDKR